MHKGSPVVTVCIFLLFLLPSLVSPECRTGTGTECQASVPYVPGLSRVKHGIDITTLSVTRDDLMDLDDRQITSSGCTLCENPLLETDELHKLPEAIIDWKANISCQQKVQYSAPKSVVSVVEVMTALSVKNDWKKGLNMNVNSSDGQWLLAGSDAHFTSFIEDKSSQDKYVFLLHHASCSYYKFGINKNKSVSKDFKDNVKILPEKFDHNSKLKYYHLIRSYGTHFITELELGVGVRILSALPVCRIQLEGLTVSMISHCLEIEVGKMIGFDEATENPDFEMCREMLKNLTSRWLFKEQLRILQGGKASFHLLFSRTVFQADSKNWLKSAEKWPALLSYSLEPLHNLVDTNDPRRDSLQQAVSEYVKERGLWRNCSHSCPPGVQQNPWDPCSCECPNNNFTNSMCCPQQLGLAKLTVKIESARGLWGDYITGSDAYVRVLFKDRFMCTPTIWNNNNPDWDANFDFGIIQVEEGFSEIEIKVWDQDSGWDDDLLGSCTLTLKAWEPTSRICYLKHGHLSFKYDLTCGPNLGGSFCWDYIVPWIEKKKIFSHDSMKQNIP